MLAVDTKRSPLPTIERIAALIAACPDPTTIAPTPPSSAAMRRSATPFVGLRLRE
jgi:hypothetical protein